MHANKNLTNIERGESFLSLETLLFTGMNWGDFAHKGVSTTLLDSVALQLDDAEMAKQSCQAVLQSANKKEKATQIVVCKETVSPGQDSCWSWVVCFAAVFSNVVICGFTYSYGILFPALLDEFQQGKANTGEETT